MERVISLTESIEFSKIKELSRNSIKVRSRYRIPWERVSLEQRFSFRSRLAEEGKAERKKRKRKERKEIQGGFVSPRNVFVNSN